MLHLCGNYYLEQIQQKNSRKAIIMEEYITKEK